MTWIARKMNKWVLDQIKPETSLKAKLKLSYFGHNMRRQGSLENKKTIVLRKIESKREKRKTNMR